MVAGPCARNKVTFWAVECANSSRGPIVSLFWAVWCWKGSPTIQRGWQCFRHLMCTRAQLWNSCMSGPVEAQQCNSSHDCRFASYGVICWQVTASNDRLTNSLKQAQLDSECAPRFLMRGSRSSVHQNWLMAFGVKQDNLFDLSSGPLLRQTNA